MLARGRGLTRFDHEGVWVMVDSRNAISHEEYLVAVTTAVCEQYPTTAARALMAWWTRRGLASTRRSAPHVVARGQGRCLYVEERLWLDDRKQ